MRGGTLREVSVIGDAWGLPLKDVGLDHYWHYWLYQANSDIWKSACGNRTAQAQDQLGGVPVLHLLMRQGPGGLPSMCPLCRKWWLTQRVLDIGSQTGADIPTENDNA